MPHCQKENFNRATKSKKDRLKQKQDALERKQKKAVEAKAAEEEAAIASGLRKNNIAMVEGFGQYEIGCEPEPEYNKFNVKKRSKKHLRIDLKKAQAREQRDEKDRLIKFQKEEYEKQRRELKAKIVEANGEDEYDDVGEEEPNETLEFFVFFCECCDRRYATKNQFLNHVNSKKHINRCKMYDELGLIVTHIELRGDNNNEQEVYNDEDNDDDDSDSDSDNYGSDKNKHIDNNEDKMIKNNGNTNGDGYESSGDDDENESDDDDDYLLVNRKTSNIFAGFADCVSSSSDDEEGDDDSDDDKGGSIDVKITSLPLEMCSKLFTPSVADDEDINFNEIIHQNQLIQNEIDEQKKINKKATTVVPSVIPFDETYNPDQFDVNENRLASVHHRLRKNLASKGIEPKRAKPEEYDPLKAITMGNTLLQQVLEASVDELQHKLDAYYQHKRECAMLGRQFALSKGNSKALPSQYIFKQDAADNPKARANVHHAGSHYHMQMSRSMQFGRQKGLMARHSSQGARLQASRMAAKIQTTRMQSGGGMKIGKKTSKKSNQKRQGRAGGSKKSDGSKKAGGD